jgi:hypothetical protein
LTRRKPRAVLAVEAVYDHGPELRRLRGDVEVIDAPDIERPNVTVRRARAVWVPDVLLKSGRIGVHHYTAAKQYLDAYEVGIMGAKNRNPLVLVDRSGGPAGMADVQLMAAREYAQATKVVGLALNPVLVWCVLGRGSLATFAAEYGWNQHMATGYLLAALDRLAEHFGLAQRDVIW